MPSYILFILFSTDSYLQLATPIKLQTIILALVFISSCLIPAFSMLLLQRGKIIGSLHMVSKEERRIPYLITALFFFLTFYLLRQVRIPSLIPLLLLGASLAMTMTMLVNLKWKISAHMVGIGGVLGAIIALSIRMYLDYRLLILGLILIAGLIGTSRMILNAHSPGEIYAGFVIGMGSQLFLFLLL